MTPSTRVRIATAPPLTEKVNPVGPTLTVGEVTCTTSSSVTPASREPVGTGKAASSAVIWVPMLSLDLPIRCDAVAAKR